MPNILKQIADLFRGSTDATPDTRRKGNPSHTKKGPGRYHAGSSRKKIRGYRKHYDRNHKS